MNIFVVDPDPMVAATQLCDQHVVKMPLENCQMLSAVFEDDYCGHPKAVSKHPCTLWLKESKQNVIWLLDHHAALLDEYTLRYNKIHKFQNAEDHFFDLLQKSDIPDIDLTPFANATPYKDMDTIHAYRHFYRMDKAKFARWKYTEMPDWLLTR